MQKYLECGMITNTHGVRGLLRVKHFCDNDEIFCALTVVYSMKNNVYKPMKVLSSAPHSGVILLGLEGIDNIDKAIPLKNMILYADRDDLKLLKGSVLIADLIGMTVTDAETGENYGTVRDVFNRGASDIYLISDGVTEFMLPAVPEFVVDIGNTIRVHLIEGMRE